MSESAMLRLAVAAAAAAEESAAPAVVTLGEAASTAAAATAAVPFPPIIEVRLNSSKRDVATGCALSPSNMLTAFSTKSLNSSVLRSWSR